MAALLQPKLTYEATAKLEVFYTGGAARLSPDGAFVACACGEETKVSFSVQRSTLPAVPTPLLSCVTPYIRPGADGRNPEPDCSQIVAVGTGKVVNTLPGVRLSPTQRFAPASNAGASRPVFLPPSCTRQDAVRGDTTRLIITIYLICLSWMSCLAVRTRSP